MVRFDSVGGSRHSRVYVIRAKNRRPRVEGRLFPAPENLGGWEASFPLEMLLSGAKWLVSISTGKLHIVSEMF